MIIFRLESCPDHDGWQLSQTSGPEVLSSSVSFDARSEAVAYAKQRCEESGCIMLIRSRQKKAPPPMSAVAR